MSESERREVRVVIRNVRSFIGTHSIRLAPLTILVGENSSGKSTFLATLSSILSRGFPLRPAFSKRPFELGGFSTIVTRSRIRAKRLDEFTMGMSEGEKGSQTYSEVLASYVGVKDRPTFSKLAISNQLGTVELLRNGKTISADVRLTGDTTERIVFEVRSNIATHYDDLPSVLVQAIVNERMRLKQPPPPNSVIQKMFEATTKLDFLGRSMRSVAPIRTKPRRIYDGLADEFSPEGDHIPPLLARAIADVEGDRDDQLRATLALFGRNSGLFRNVDIRTLGDQPSAPFQLLARMAGVTANMTDVGYGVSQVLPVLVECLTMPHSGGVLALQQPEVHLHPRAQAELGSMCADVVSVKPKSTLIVETHSDYLLNRVRRKVAEKKLAPRDVSLLFFEKREAATKVHHVDLDDFGNLVNAPKAYRAFFVSEELDLLSRGDA